MLSLLKEWSDLLISSGLGLTLLLYFKKIIEAKKLRKQLKEITDKKQDERLLIIEKKIKEDKIEHEKIMSKITYIYDSIKNTTFKEQIELELSKYLNKSLKINRINNKALIRLLNNNIKAYIELVEDILLYSFELTINQVEEMALRHIGNAKRLISMEKLYLVDPGKFIYALHHEIMYPSLKDFILAYSELDTLENGTRRNKFKQLSLKYNEDIIRKAILLYLRSKKTTK